MMISLFLDLAIVALLIMTLVGGYRFHRKLQTFQTDAKEFEPLIHALDQAAKRAEAVLGNLRQIAEDVGAKLTSEADNTQRMLDELDFMTKRADQLAEKLDGAISSARPRADKEPPKAPVAETVASGELVATRPSEQRRRAPDLEKRLKNLR